MQLTYHKGKNFGDAINPYIFEQLLPHFFDEDSSEIFIGIGSLLGLKKGEPNTKKKIVFSSGYAAGNESTYGTPPKIDDSYDIICVRGPLTAKYFNLPKEKAVADGALLLHAVYKEKVNKKKYAFSYMPHVGSFAFYSQWESLLASINIHLIDPRGEYMEIMKELQETEVLFAEAMHGAIIGDTLRTPWIPIITAKTINKFKWEDYTSSINLPYTPHYVPSLFQKSFMEQMLVNKFPFAKPFAGVAGSIYDVYRSTWVEKQVKNTFLRLMNEKAYLSTDAILDEKVNLLLDKLEDVKKAYTRK